MFSWLLGFETKEQKDIKALRKMSSEELISIVLNVQNKYNSLVGKVNKNNEEIKVFVQSIEKDRQMLNDDRAQLIKDRESILNNFSENNTKFIDATADFNRIIKSANERITSLEMQLMDKLQMDKYMDVTLSSLRDKNREYEILLEEKTKLESVSDLKKDLTKNINDILNPLIRRISTVDDSKMKMYNSLFNKFNKLDVTDAAVLNRITYAMKSSKYLEEEKIKTRQLSEKLVTLQSELSNEIKQLKDELILITSDLKQEKDRCNTLDNIYKDTMFKNTELTNLLDVITQRNRIIELENMDLTDKLKDMNTLIKENNSIKQQCIEIQSANSFLFEENTRIIKENSTLKTKLEAIKMAANAEQKKHERKDDEDSAGSSAVLREMDKIKEMINKQSLVLKEIRESDMLDLTRRLFSIDDKIEEIHDDTVVKNRNLTQDVHNLHEKNNLDIKLDDILKNVQQIKFIKDTTTNLNNFEILKSTKNTQFVDKFRNEYVKNNLQLPKNAKAWMTDEEIDLSVKYGIGRMKEMMKDKERLKR